MAAILPNSEGIASRTFRDRKVVSESGNMGNIPRVEFGQRLELWLKLREMSPQAFAIAAGYEGSGYVSNVLAGRRVPPDEKVLEWARILQLPAKETAILREEGRRSRLRSNAEFAELIDQLERDNDSLRSKAETFRVLLLETARAAQNAGVQLSDKIVQFIQSSERDG